MSLQRGVGTPRAVRFAPKRAVELTVGPGGAWRVVAAGAVTLSESSEVQALLSFDGTQLKVRALSGQVQVDGAPVLTEMSLPTPCRLCIGQVVLSCDSAPPSHGNYVDAAGFGQLDAHTRAVPQFAAVAQHPTTLIGFRTPVVSSPALDAKGEARTEPSEAQASEALEAQALEAEALFARTRKLSPEDLASSGTRPESRPQVTAPHVETPEAAAGRRSSTPPEAAAPTKALLSRSSIEPATGFSARRSTTARNALAIGFSCLAAGAVGWSAARWSGSGATTLGSPVAANAALSVPTDVRLTASREHAATEYPAASVVVVQGAASDGGVPNEQRSVVANEPLLTSKTLLDLEARAIEALASGQRELSLSLYEQLEQVAPSVLVYAEVTQMLRANKNIAASHP